MNRVRIPETVVEGKRLGRHIYHDPRSRDFEVAASTKLVSVRHKSIGLPLDQGEIGSCTANALVGFLNTQPNVPAHGPWTEKGAIRLYERETANEGQPYPPNDPGGSGLEVCKAAVQLKMISSYKHAFSLQAALSALVSGPVITGVDWYEGFDTPNTGPKGFGSQVSISGSVRGGHEFVADEIDVEDKLVGFTNSWGPSYGLGGRFYMTWDTWGTLLSQGGDVTVPVK
jgi:hypothetical protein